MIWLAFALTGVSVAILAWSAQSWVGPALQRYRQIYTQETGVKLSELFLFIDPAQLWLAALVCAALGGLLAWGLSGSWLVGVLAGLAATRVPSRLVESLRRRRLLRFERQLSGVGLRRRQRLHLQGTLGGRLRLPLSWSDDERPPLSRAAAGRLLARLGRRPRSGRSRGVRGRAHALGRLLRRPLHRNVRGR